MLEVSTRKSENSEEKIGDTVPVVELVVLVPNMAHTLQWYI
jgi:hypothetical protein